VNLIGLENVFRELERLCGLSEPNMDKIHLWILDVFSDPNRFRKRITRT
jgi:hypothetical protein